MWLDCGWGNSESEQNLWVHEELCNKKLKKNITGSNVEHGTLSSVAGC